MRYRGRKAAKKNVNAPQRPARQCGMALIGAIAMLFLFVALGTAYVRSMAIEFDETRSHIDRVRAAHLAQGGIEAAIGEIQAALAGGVPPQASFTFTINVYRYEHGQAVPYEQQVRVQVRDEAARVNLNHAPPALLKALGFDDRSVNALRSALPGGTGPRVGPRRWLNTVDELTRRELVDRGIFKNLNRDHFTTHTVSDLANPSAFINLNSAPPEILAAIFAIDDMDEARELAAERPFADWQDVVQKTGREPSRFNVKPGQYASRRMPGELAFSSRCFRVHSEVSYQIRGTRRRPVSAAVEAVILFNPDGTHTIRYWDESPREITSPGEEMEQSPPAEAGPAGAEPDGGEAGNEQSEEA